MQARTNAQGNSDSEPWGAKMEELHKFLNEVRTSTEFQNMALRAAKEAGHNLSSSDDALGDELNARLTLIISQVLFELSDGRFIGRTHHRRKLYNQDCRGPLCRKAERDRSRERYRTAHAESASRRQNKRASTFDDQVLEFVAKKYDARLEAENTRGTAA